MSTKIVCPNFKNISRVADDHNAIETIRLIIRLSYHNIRPTGVAFFYHWKQAQQQFKQWSTCTAKLNNTDCKVHISCITSIKARYTGWWTTDGGRSIARLLTSAQSSSSIDRCAHAHNDHNSKRLSPMMSRYCFHHLFVTDIDVYIINDGNLIKIDQSSFEWNFIVSRSIVYQKFYN